MNDNVSQAISAALQCDWKSAIKINTLLLKRDPNNIDALNRLGRALLETGENKKAATTFRKVLKLDKYNPIADKNLARTAQTINPTKKSSSMISASTFLEEPGKTKLVQLVNLASISVILKQNPTDSVNLIPKRHTVVVENTDGVYLGALADDLGHRLSILIKGGNKYITFIKCISKNSITVFIKEEAKAKKFKDTPSFSVNNADYIASVEEGRTETPDVSTNEEDEENHKPKTDDSAD